MAAGTSEQVTGIIQAGGDGGLDPGGGRGGSKWSDSGSGLVGHLWRVRDREELRTSLRVLGLATKRAGLSFTADQGEDWRRSRFWEEISSGEDKMRFLLDNQMQRSLWMASGHYLNAQFTRVAKS